MTSAPDGVRWLNESERATWLAVIGVWTRMPAALDAQLQREAGVNFYEYLILAILSESEGRTLQMSQLANLVSSSLSRLSHAVTRLEKLGFAQRKQVEGAPGRRMNVTLTEVGAAKLEETAPGHVTQVRELFFDSMTDDQVVELRRMAESVLMTLDRAAS